MRVYTFEKEDLRSLLSAKPQHRRFFLSASEPRPQRPHCDIPPRGLLFAADKPQTDRGIFTPAKRTAKHTAAPPNGNEKKPSNLFLAGVVSSLLLSLTQMRSVFLRNSVTTQTQISCHSEPSRCSCDARKKCVCKQRDSWEPPPKLRASMTYK